MTNLQSINSGSLYIVATPIGNLDDISLRALSVLKSVDFIIAEDTRHSQTLLQHFGIKKPLTSLHAFNETQKSQQLLISLEKGQSAALISDAGTPLISDPGFPLVRLAKKHHILVTPIPGPCALISALSAAGIPCDSFTFTGFLPAKQTARIEKLKQLSSINHTLIFYESSHRIKASVKDMGEVFGENCEMVLAKELTKTHERFVDGQSKDILCWLEADPAHQKGEFVIIIAPREEKAREYETILRRLMNELPLRKAVDLTSQITLVNKNEIYKTALKMQA
ncbi:16S rRNA (cytidine(1402)-2'-O)-methyltransferase [Legionella israelensis]|uniref:Ribosomal RNA small subunit methyltransferase I n=1 Tax=Legionella israelensis TaxID=454 RepID=A0A0W0V1T2_9GAMM|nr:16S rRNA (cytidine(1402)-2'-O)-methyltransferase [Legionella israelensis]KTD14042.1 tetrapyrrole (corrin/porphyrin) methylase [Legionella israelensis]QBS09694.1 16S rRNA (cytidine(1402)-2'-O)-methyltransferase [Legionella israelensis]SCY04475.1 16S rRNA (cytidine1402-2'-O)-methyltransferase [Legionella israelensis DSM 19235]STX60633.1 tetrapyrrole (corrin/porphyrin) methylase [Legionella israelensis]